MVKEDDGAGLRHDAVRSQGGLFWAVTSLLGRTHADIQMMGRALNHPTNLQIQRKLVFKSLDHKYLIVWGFLLLINVFFLFECFSTVHRFLNLKRDLPQFHRSCQVEPMVLHKHLFPHLKRLRDTSTGFTYQILLILLGRCSRKRCLN